MRPAIGLWVASALPFPWEIIGPRLAIMSARGLAALAEDWDEEDCCVAAGEVETIAEGSRSCENMGPRLAIMPASGLLAPAGESRELEEPPERSCANIGPMALIAFRIISAEGAPPRVAGAGAAEALSSVAESCESVSSSTGSLCAKAESVVFREAAACLACAIATFFTSHFAHKS